jgi:aminoglycoside phosphotransferase (APT) family kinase protein
MPDDFRRLLLARGVLRSPDSTLTPLTGGVSSEIYRADDGDRVFVVKRALAKLKVAADWFADTGRNAHEQAYLAYVADFRPDAVPRVIAGDAAEGWFAMEFLEGFSNWKTELLAGRSSPEVAARAAGVLGEIHARSRGDDAARARFATDRNFHELRVAPYLLAAADRHPDLAPAIRAEAARLASRRECLVHGDYSPKNLLVRTDRLVVLDCEVAWFGDPAFDLAFLLNHLCLKALYHVLAGSASAYDGAAHVRAALGAYAAAYPLHNDVFARTGGLLRWLLLARVDGKSPVEYLDEVACFHVRHFIRAHAGQAAPEADALCAAWFAALPAPVSPK